MKNDKEKIDSLIEKARSAFTNRQPESFHEALSRGCKIYIAKDNSLDCSNCDLVVPYSHDMLEDALQLFKKQFD